jgi:hypothetical protein
MSSRPQAMMIEERQRDYSLFFPSPLASNGQQPAQQLRIDTDGPFVLREVGFSTAGGVLPQSIAIKYQDDIGRFVQQDFIASFGELPFSGAALTGYNGLIPFFTPVLPQIVYPPNATIVVYLENTNPVQTLTGARIIFRGVSLHPRGTVLNGWAYPPYFREIPFAYAENILVNTLNPQLNNVLNIKPDADFVLRALQIIPVSSVNVIQPSFGDKYLIQFKDQNGKYYQTGSNSDSIQSAGIFPDSIAGHLTPYAPGILVPEIYLQKNSALYYDVKVPSQPVNLVVRFIGSKIFESATPC